MTFPEYRFGGTVKRYFQSVLFLCAVTLAVLPALQAQTYFDRLLGHKQTHFNARGMALGHTGVASSYSASAMLTNPALLWQAFGAGENHHRVYADATYIAIRPSENRLFPMLDTFGDVITETIYATNSPMYGRFNAGVLYKYNNNFYFGLGNFSYYTFDYDYKERLAAQLPNTYVNRDPFLDYQTKYSRGQWRAWTLSHGFVYNQFSIGASLNFIYSNDFKDRYRYSLLNLGYTAVQDTFAYGKKYKGGTGMNIVLGASYRISEHWHIGASISTPASVKTKNGIYYTGMDTLTGLPTHFVDTVGSYKKPKPLNVTYKQPAVYSFGAEYRPKNELFSRVTAELNFTNWKSYKQKFSRRVPVMGDTVNAYSPKFENVWDVRVGIEHMFFGYVPLRFGFAHLGSPMGDAYGQTMFDVGTGYEYGALKFDAAIEIANRDYKYRILFPQRYVAGSATNRERTYLDKVEESMVSFQFTMSYRFDFVK